MGINKKKMLMRGVGGGIDLTPNLISYYELNEVDVDTDDYLFDSWGSNDAIILAGALVEAYTPGIVGRCIDRPVGSNKVNIPTASGDFDFGDSGGSEFPFSVSIWNNIATWDTGGNWLLSRRSTSAFRDWEFKLLRDEAVHGDNVQIWLSDGTNFIMIRVLVDKADYEGDWHHYLFTYDGSKTVAGLKLYLDGVLYTQTTETSGTYTGMTNIPNKIEIGNKSWQNGNPIDLLDEIKFWDKEFSQEEVTQDYDNGIAGIPLT